METYTKKTFSSERYSIWTMQSSYHSLPEVNGIMQHQGREYEAGEITTNFRGNKKIFKQDISKAYPDEAGIKSWKRIMTVQNKQITVQDDYELDDSGAVKFNFITNYKPELKEKGLVTIPLSKNPNQNPLMMTFDQGDLSFEVEKINLTDEWLKPEWDGAVYRIILTKKQETGKGKFRFRFY